MSLKILFTCVGRRVELMQAFRHASEKLNIKLVIYGADVSFTAPALAFCNRTIKTCEIKDTGYIKQLLEICFREEIDALIPTIDTDLLILALNKEKFETIGTHVIVSAADKVRICRDKRLTSDFFLSCGLNAPTPVDDYLKYKGGYPAFIKPIDGSSSINAFVINSEDELEEKARHIDNYIVQPFVSGKEYTVDIFCDLNSRPIYITPRERVAVRSGEVLKTKISQDKIIIEECKKLIEAFQPIGQITVQLIRDSISGKNYYIEINPRFGGGAPLSIKAGADSAKALLSLLLKDELFYQDNAAIDGAIYSRFDQSVCVDNGVRPSLKAVIFDLDDTLYSEKDYIRSGFRAIETKYGISPSSLWSAFKSGQPAIDSVLSDNKRLDLKEDCLSVYRNHFPEIKLYPMVREMFTALREQGVFIGVVTDGRPEGQQAKIKALKLESLVDSIIITDELGGERFRKPCDIAFRIMQRKANVDYGQMAYVGDNLSKDFIAPRQLGMQCVLFKNPDGLYKAEYTKEDVPEFVKIVDSISELHSILLLLSDKDKFINYNPNFQAPMRKTDNKRIIAYLDLLGFSNYCENDPFAAETLLRDFSIALEEIWSDKNAIPFECRVSTFEYFLPFSDCVFIIAKPEDYCLFLKQLSNFLCNVFWLNARAYATSPTPSNPTRIKVTCINFKESNEKEESKKRSSLQEENWFPSMWRGGITIGDVKILDGEIKAITGNELKNATIALGAGVVSAVELEKKSGRGPRIFCSKEFVEQLPNCILEHYLSQEGDKYDLLWPKFFSEEYRSDVTNAVKKLKSWIDGAQEESSVKEQYSEFLDLLKRSDFNLEQSFF